jgi:hypothetical protein
MSSRTALLSAVIPLAAIASYAGTAHAQVVTTTTLTIEDTAPAFGTDVSLAATVKGSSPTGTVSFIGNVYANNGLGSCVLSGGACSVVINDFLPGTQIILANYGGDSNNFASGTSEHTITVGPRTLMSSETTLSASTTSTTPGSAVTLVADVRPIRATGTVTFKNGSTVIGQAPFLPLEGSGISGAFLGLSLGNTADPIGADNTNGPVYPNVTYGVTRSWGQSDLTWGSINTARGVYDWTKLDAWVAQNAGHELLFELANTPQWASSYPDNPCLYGAVGACAAPSSMSYWNDWVTSVATRYASSIKYWEIWNEPQNPGFWGGATAGAAGSIPTMVAMATSAYSIIKKIAPEAQVVSPAPTSWGYASSPGQERMEAFLADGGATTFDILGFHGYLWVDGGEAELENPIVAQVNSVMTAASLSKPIWDTEASWCCDVVLDSSRQAGFVSKMFILHQSLGVARLIRNVSTRMRHEA